MTGPRAWPPHQLLGVVLAGGESRRYGRPKVLAPVGGRPMGRWALDALGPHFSLRGVIVNDPLVAQAFGVPSRRDSLPGLGPLGGLITALEWARDLRLGGAFILGCDMPLVDAGMVGRILGFRGGRKVALVPASRGPLGMEPLCAVYDVDSLRPARELARSGSLSMKAFLSSIDFHRVPLEELGDPEEVALAFTNVNTVREGRRIEEVLRARGKGLSTAGRTEDGRDGR